MLKKTVVRKSDKDLVKNSLVRYCVDGYQSFRSVEHEGLRDLLQLHVDLGAKYGKLRVCSVVQYVH